MIRTGVFQNLSSNFELGGDGLGELSHVLQAPLTRRIFISRATAGFKPGPLWVGVYSLCARYRPFYPPNPSAWTGFVSKATCRPGHSFRIQSVPLPGGRVVKLDEDVPISGITYGAGGACIDNV